jgi:preprotein translocase subunit SecE
MANNERTTEEKLKSVEALQKQVDSAAGRKSATKEKKGLINYFKGVRQELKKVVWPTKDELVTSTLVVLITCTFFSVAFWLIDTGFLAALKGILGVTLS